MCRLLAVKSLRPFEVAEHLRPFATIARTRREFQGHGWGCATLDEQGQWRLYHHIRPVWEDDLGQFGRTRLLIAHARSAFRDEGIAVENNMPFTDGRAVFAFNGELRGVRIREAGRIGAERVFNYIRRLDRGDLNFALRRAVDLIPKRSRYVRAMNIILSDGARVLVSSQFNEDVDYFTMHFRTRDDGFIVCSDPYPGEKGWRPIDNRSVRVLT